MKRWLHEIDLLRTIAIVVIVLGHYDEFMNSKSLLLSLKPYFALFSMAVFFFISGYAIHMNNDHINTIKDVITFYRKRIARILPLYWLAVILFFIMYVPLQLAQFFQGDYFDFSLKSVVVHLFGLQSFYGHFFPAMWFIGIILVYYIVYPFILKFGKDNTLAIVFASFITILALFVLTHPLGIIKDNDLYFYFIIFMAGSLAHKTDLMYSSSHKKYIRFVPIVTLLLLFVYIWIYNGVNVTLQDFSVRNFIFYCMYFILKTILSVLIAISLYGLAMKSVTILNKSAIGVITKISYGSYATYLFHEQLFVVLFLALSWISLAGIDRDIVIALLGIPSALVMGYFVQKAYDYFNKIMHSGIFGRQTGQAPTVK